MIISVKTEIATEFVVIILVDVIEVATNIKVLWILDRKHGDFTSLRRLFKGELLRFRHK